MVERMIFIIFSSKNKNKMNLEWTGGKKRKEKLSQLIRAIE